MDPSPYMLKHAATEHAEIRFVQGSAESTGFPDGRFDAIAVCFVLHEIPIRYLAPCLTELHRILVPGGRIAICEPSSAQFEGGFWRQLCRHGLRHAYFNLLARFVYEPFVRAWHRIDVRARLGEAGFEVLGDEQDPPVRFVLARKPA